jgi:Caspase domain
VLADTLMPAKRGKHFIRLAFGISLLALTLRGFTSPEQSAGPQQPERFALLVGINDYAQPSNHAYQIMSLRGPANDVEMMKDLLTTRYKFPNDREHVLPLIGKDATHEAIEQKFKTQLIDNAAKHADALVVFYFSGHGSQLRLDQLDNSLHDTLVAYDSRADVRSERPYQGSDILDTELTNWLEALRVHTKNIVLIFDSCHSGDAIRDITLTPKEAPPNPNGLSGMASETVARDVQGANASIDSVSRREQFAVLSSSLADQPSYEGAISDLPGQPYHGLFTYFLFSSLTLHPDLNYEQAAREITIGLNRRSYLQNPVPAGNTQTKVFGGLGDSDDPYVPIAAKLSNTRFEIRAGRNFGLDPGTFLAVYAATAKHLSGDTGKIANARVIEADDVTSTAELSEAPTKPLSTADKVAIVTPFFGFGPMVIRLSDLPGEETTGADHALLSQVQDILKDNKLFKIAAAGDTWGLAIRRGCRAGEQLIVSTNLKNGAQPCRPEYYLTGTSDSPLLGLSVAADDPTAASRLATAAEKHAKQENIRALDDAQSPLSGKVRLELIKVDVRKSANGRDVAVPLTDSASSAPQVLHVGQNFLVKVENESQKDIYAATFVLGSSGSVQLLTTNPHGQLIHANESVTSEAPWTIGLPEGRETYKVFATTSPDVNYLVFEQPGARAITTSPFEWVLNQTTNTLVRDPNRNEELKLSNWTTAWVDITVRK